MTTDAAALWSFLPLGYALSVLLETPVLLAGLSRRHSALRRIFAGFWLTAGTYPIVVLVLPPVMDYCLGPDSYWQYLVVAEIFAPAAECAMFWAAFWMDPLLALRASGEESREARNTNRRDFGQDMLTIVAANVCSFVVGGAILYFASVS